jgi:hypothetical protein
LPDDTELLEQRVTKRKQKLEQAAAVVSMVQDRLASATAADEEAGRELRTLRAALKAAEKKAKLLKKRTQQARDLSASAEDDRLSAERELGEELQRYEKQQSKLAKAEAALAAALATQRVEEVAPPGAPDVSEARDGPAGSSAPAKRSTAKKAAPARKRTASAKKTTSGRTTRSSTSGTAKKAPARTTSTRQPRPTT